MKSQQKIISEHIEQIIEGMPGTCFHKKAETIVRGKNCLYLSIPKSDIGEPIKCKLLGIEAGYDCFCCWGKVKPYPTKF